MQKTGFAEKKSDVFDFPIAIFCAFVFPRAPERRFGGIGRRARLKIEYLRVWVRVPQPLLFGKQNHTPASVVFCFSDIRNSGRKKSMCLRTCFEKSDRSDIRNCSEDQFRRRNHRRAPIHCCCRNRGCSGEPSERRRRFPIGCSDCKAGQAMLVHRIHRLFR